MMDRFSNVVGQLIEQNIKEIRAGQSDVLLELKTKFTKGTSKTKPATSVIKTDFLKRPEGKEVVEELRDIAVSVLGTIGGRPVGSKAQDIKKIVDDLNKPERAAEKKSILDAVKPVLAVRKPREAVRRAGRPPSRVPATPEEKRAIAEPIAEQPEREFFDRPQGAPPTPSIETEEQAASRIEALRAAEGVAQSERSGQAAQAAQERQQREKDRIFLRELRDFMAEVTTGRAGAADINKHRVRAKEFLDRKNIPVDERKIIADASIMLDTVEQSFAQNRGHDFDALDSMRDRITSVILTRQQAAGEEFFIDPAEAELERQIELEGQIELEVKTSPSVFDPGAAQAVGRQPAGGGVNFLDQKQSATVGETLANLGLFSENIIQTIRGILQGVGDLESTVRGTDRNTALQVMAGLALIGGLQGLPRRSQTASLADLLLARGISEVPELLDPSQGGTAELLGGLTKSQQERVKNAARKAQQESKAGVPPTPVPEGKAVGAEGVGAEGVGGIGAAGAAGAAIAGAAAVGLADEPSTTVAPPTGTPPPSTTGTPPPLTGAPPPFIPRQIEVEQDDEEKKQKGFIQKNQQAKPRFIIPATKVLDPGNNDQSFDMFNATDYVAPFAEDGTFLENNPLKMDNAIFDRIRFGEGGMTEYTTGFNSVLQGDAELERPVNLASLPRVEFDLSEFEEQPHNPNVSFETNLLYNNMTAVLSTKDQDQDLNQSILYGVVP